MSCKARKTNKQTTKIAKRAMKGKETIPEDLVPLYSYSRGEDGSRNFKVHCAYFLKSCGKMRSCRGVKDEVEIVEMFLTFV
jgi:hypothetical protein